jgi:hypothetical protein
MNKNDVAGTIVYAILFGLAIYIGLEVIRPLIISVGQTLGYSIYLYAILCVAIGILLNVAILELGHIVGAKIGGYSILFVIMLGLAIYREKGKWKIGFKSYDGFTGETKIAPKKANLKILPYVWFPILFFIIELIGTILLFTFATIYEDNTTLQAVSCGGIIVSSIGGLITLYNVIPFRLDSLTDGYRLTLLSKPINIEAYNALIAIEANEYNGIPIENYKTFDVITDFTASLNMYAIYNALSKKEYEKAETLLEKIIAGGDKVGHQIVDRAKAQMLYIKLMTLPLEEAKTFYDSVLSSDTRRFISEDVSMESVRAYILISGLLDESQGEVNYAIARKERALKKTLEGRKELEIRMYDEVLEKVDKVHPDWKLLEKIEPVKKE